MGGCGTGLPFQTFVISLERARDRRAHMERLLRDLGMSAEFVPAVDGRALSAQQRSRYDAARARVDYRAEMSDAEIGCYLSHYGLYERMCREGIPLALILEDDICASPTLPQIVAELAGHPERSWDVVRLQTARRKVAEPVSAAAQGALVRPVRGGGLYRLDTHVLGGCGYLITLKGAQTMLSFGARITRPIDQTLDRFWENGIRPYVVRPFPVWQAPEIQSEIAVRGRAVEGYAERLADVWAGRAHRALDGVSKRLFLLRDRGVAMPIALP